MKKNTIIIGGGIAGLLSALILSKKSDSHVHIIEQKDILGGLYGYFDYGKYGRFDYGAHNILETGITELDILLTNLLPNEDWFITSAINESKRTLAGLFFNDNLQLNVPFLDLRNYSEKEKKLFFDDLLLASPNNKVEDPSLISAYDYALSLFGKSITDIVISKVLYNVFGVDSRELNSMCLLLMGINRVCLLDKDEMERHKDKPNILSRLCYPDQRNVPKQYLKSNKAYYPKKFGMYRIVDALEKKLLDAGNVTVHKNSNVNKIEQENNNITGVEINNTLYTNIDYLISSTNLSTLSNLLNLKMDDISYEKSPKTVITNILIDKPLKVEDISYFGCYDKDFKTYRVDNYFNYCGDGAIREDLYPITIEMIIPEEEINIDEIKITAIEELKKFNVLEKNTNIPFIETEVLDYGFPLLSQINVKSSDILRKRIEDQNIKNLIKVGILSEKDLFFEGEIKVDLFKKLNNL